MVESVNRFHHLPKNTLILVFYCSQNIIRNLSYLSIVQKINSSFEILNLGGLFTTRWSFSFHLNSKCRIYFLNVAYLSRSSIISAQKNGKKMT
jgi:hypothetical protein